MSKVIDKNNPMYGKTHTLEARRKISESRKKYTMENHPQWKGGKRISSAGYIEVRNKDHHRVRKNGYVFEHIIVAEKMLGRKIKQNEHVHHKNEIKSDNRPENLMVMSRGEHSSHHAKSRRKGSYVVCEQCNKEFYVKPSRVAKARFCSARCNGLSSEIGKIYKQIKRHGVINDEFK